MEVALLGKIDGSFNVTCDLLKDKHPLTISFLVHIVKTYEEPNLSCAQSLAKLILKCLEGVQALPLEVDD